MSLVSTYKGYILEQLMLEYLRDGIIPTSEQLEEDLEAYTLQHPNLEEPRSKTTDFSVERGTSSSASHIQNIAEIVSQDVGVVTREIHNTTTKSATFYDRWSNEVKRLYGMAKKLEQRVDSLLLLNAETVGFFAFVGDVFSDMNKVDTANTTARINLYEASVSIDPARSELSDGSGGTLIDLSAMTENDVSFVPLSKRPGVVYFTTNDGNSLSNIFKTDDSTWVGKVVANTTGEIVCELKAKLSSTEDLEVSKVSLQFTGPTTTSRSTVSLQYSTDGYVWNLVPAVDSTKVLTRNMAWTFPKSSLRWVKLIFRKPAPDNPENEYIFSASHMRIYGDIFDTSTGATLISNALQAINTQGNPIKFSLLALDVCTELPTDTSISYAISASKDNSTWTDWIGISPSDQEEVLNPKIINLGGVDWKNNQSEDNTTKLDTTVTLGTRGQMKLTQNFSNSSITGLTGYRFKDNSFAAINIAILISPDQDPNPIAASTVVWRNIRYKNITDYPDILTVRSNPRGWGIDGENYTCFFEVISSDGIVLDFGDRECVLNGATTKGVVKVPSGIYKFSTNAINWYDIASDIAGLRNAAVLTEEELKSIDPLYPHNHKLVIEGFLYSDSYIGEQVYRGTDISAEFYAKKVSLFDLENNINDYSNFAVRGVGNETNPTLAIITNFNASNPDSSNELFLVKWRSGTTDASMYSYVKLKAVLQTQDTSVSPLITSYRIKLGV